ncbi:hypothetical protein, conserved in T. vivax [Trypanosoma vivax Y486]|uniref:Uncharacterized protein n=1 Tax=Trypanosoma vivax (strain Y486) TaxID=1055687 RepID=F9WS10_TRYVY|nr:hypothetical protein, conserved in T. vivax [Trypanosoma vivax Y486]|eukprot:CCD20347.1 hypothetical protein, conserved in T. vivax [Trypanosoma vivax Y486]
MANKKGGKRFSPAPPRSPLPAPPLRDAHLLRPVSARNPVSRALRRGNAGPGGPNTLLFQRLARRRVKMRDALPHNIRHLRAANANMQISRNLFGKGTERQWRCAPHPRMEAPGAGVADVNRCLRGATALFPGNKLSRRFPCLTACAGAPVPPLSCESPPLGFEGLRRTAFTKKTHSSRAPPRTPCATKAFQFRNRESFQRRRLPELPYRFWDQANGPSFAVERRPDKATLLGEAAALTQSGPALPRVPGCYVAPLLRAPPRPTHSNVAGPNAYFYWPRRATSRTQCRGVAGKRARDRARHFGAALASHLGPRGLHQPTRPHAAPETCATALWQTDLEEGCL